MKPSIYQLARQRFADDPLLRRWSELLLDVDPEGFESVKAAIDYWQWLATADAATIAYVASMMHDELLSED